MLPLSEALLVLAPCVSCSLVGAMYVLVAFVAQVLTVMQAALLFARSGTYPMPTITFTNIVARQCGVGSFVLNSSDADVSASTSSPAASAVPALDPTFKVDSS